MSENLVTPNGRILKPGFKGDELKNIQSSPWKNLTYDQDGTIFDKIFNIGRLQSTKDLSGWEKATAKLSNVGAIMINPFATIEVWRNIIKTGEFI